MEAEALFFDGQVRAEVLLAHAGVKWTRGGEGGTEAAGERRGHGGFRGGFGGGGGFRGGRHREGGEYAEGGEGGGEAGEGAEGAGAPRIVAENQRPLELRLRLTNLGKQPISVEVPDFDSVLGDFAVQPDTIVVAPGKSVEAEPMVSRMGVTLPEIPLTVSLQVGNKTEQHVLTLRPIHPAAPPSGTAAPADAAASP